MALWSARTRRTTRHEYVLPNPSNFAEVGKAFAAATDDFQVAMNRPTTDDSIWVTHEDEEIIIYWEETK